MNKINRRKIIRTGKWRRQYKQPWKAPRHQGLTRVRGFPEVGLSTTYIHRLRQRHGTDILHFTFHLTSCHLKKARNWREWPTSVQTRSGLCALSDLKHCRCLVCRQRKVACDRRKPRCGLCEKNNFDCEYKPRDHRPGLRAGYVTLLESRVGKEQSAANGSVIQVHSWLGSHLPRAIGEENERCCRSLVSGFIPK